MSKLLHKTVPFLLKIFKSQLSILALYIKYSLKFGVTAFEQQNPAKFLVGERKYLNDYLLQTCLQTGPNPELGLCSVMCRIVGSIDSQKGGILKHFQPMDASRKFFRFSMLINTLSSRVDKDGVSTYSSSIWIAGF